jgi:hypothetical protein
MVGMTYEKNNTFFIHLMASRGARVIAVVNGKRRTLWQGTGNLSGLHDYADTLLKETYDKGADRLSKKLETLPVGTPIELYDYRNITRDRGKWVKIG